MSSRSPQGGPAVKITKEVETEFKEALKAGGFSDFVIHAPYIINFGSGKPQTFHGSISIVRGNIIYKFQTLVVEDFVCSASFYHHN
jgi:endonuclease IV